MEFSITISRFVEDRMGFLREWYESNAFSTVNMFIHALTSFHKLCILVKVIHNKFFQKFTRNVIAHINLLGKYECWGETLPYKWILTCHWRVKELHILYANDLSNGGIYHYFRVIFYVNYPKVPNLIPITRICYQQNIHVFLENLCCNTNDLIQG